MLFDEINNTCIIITFVIIFNDYIILFAIVKHTHTTYTPHFTVLDKNDSQHGLCILKSGDCIGEQDVECGRPRSSTVITESSVELAALHRLVI